MPTQNLATLLISVLESLSNRGAGLCSIGTQAHSAPCIILFPNPQREQTRAKERCICKALTQLLSCISHEPECCLEAFYARETEHISGICPLLGVGKLLSGDQQSTSSGLTRRFFLVANQHAQQASLTEGCKLRAESPPTDRLQNLELRLGGFAVCSLFWQNDVEDFSTPIERPCPVLKV